MGWQQAATFGSAALFTVASTVLAPAPASPPGPAVNLLPADKVTLSGAGLIGTSVSYYTSYEIQIFATDGETGGTTIGCALVTVSWYTNVADVRPISETIWYIPANATGVLTIGRGPQRGNYMAITVQSMETTNITSFTVVATVTGSQRAYANDNWTSNGTPQPFTGTNAKPFTNELLSINNANIAGSGGTQTRATLLYAGKAHLWIANLAAAGTFQGTLSDAIGGVGGSTRTFWNGPIPEIGSGPVNIDLELPQFPLALTVANSGAGAGTLSATLVADRV